jgi:hypothetical protein
VEGVAVDADPTMDEEAIERAIRQAQILEEDDPNAAKQLMAQAQAAKQKLGSPVSLREPYDATRTLARVLLGYKGGVTYSCVNSMDYRCYFGLVRELDLYLEEKNNKRNSQYNKTVDAAYALNDFPRAQEYTGEVRRLI